MDALKCVSVRLSSLTGINLLLSDVVPLLFANHVTGVFQRIFSSPFIMRKMYCFISSYSLMGTFFLYSLMENNFSKLYFLPNSVYCAEVIRSCKTSRCAAMGLLAQFSIRHDRNRAKRDMAGLSSFIVQQSRILFRET